MAKAAPLRRAGAVLCGRFNDEKLGKKHFVRTDNRGSKSEMCVLSVSECKSKRAGSPF